MFWALVAVVALSIPLVAVILDSQVGRALASRLERGTGGSADRLDRRVAELEAEVERMGREIRRLEEESEFLHKLLEGKPAGGELTSGEPHD